MTAITEHYLGGLLITLRLLNLRKSVALITLQILGGLQHIQTLLKHSAGKWTLWNFEYRPRNRLSLNDQSEAFPLYVLLRDV